MCKIYKDLIESLCQKEIVLASTIKTQNGLSGSTEQAYSFIITVIRAFNHRISDNNISQSITDGDRDGSIDAIVIPKNKEKPIQFYDCTNDGWNFRDTKNFLRDFEEYIFNGGDISSLNDKVKSQIILARKAIRKGRKVELFLVHKVDNEPSTSELDKARQLKNSSEMITNIHFINVSKLSSQLTGYSSDKESILWELKINKKMTFFIKNNKKIDSVTTLIHPYELISLAKKYDDKNESLFEKNIRGFLENKSISEEIILSLNERPEEFYFLNNGLTIVCNDASEHLDLLNISNPQVVNGCQTVSTILKAYLDGKISRENLRKAFILCRFYVIKDYDKVERICQATNTQVKVGLDDLRSQDKIQKAIDILFKLNGAAYKRKKEKGINGPSLAKTTQLLFAAKLYEPADAKNKKNFLFDKVSNQGFYKRIYSQSLTFDEILKICDIGKFVNRKVKSIRNRDFEKDADLHFVAGVYYLLQNKNYDSTKYERAFKLCNKIIKEIVKEQRRRNKKITNNKIFTKSKQTWTDLKQSLSTTPRAR